MLCSQETRKVRVGIDLALKEVNLDDYDIFLGAQFHIKVLFTNIQLIILLPHTYPIQIIVNIVKSITSLYSKLHWFESSRVEFQNLKKDSKNFVSDRNLLWKPELRWQAGKLEMEETEAVVRTFLCLHKVSYFFYLFA